MDCVFQLSFFSPSMSQFIVRFKCVFVRCDWLERGLGCILAIRFVYARIMPVSMLLT